MMRQSAVIVIVGAFAEDVHHLVKCEGNHDEIVGCACVGDDEKSGCFAVAHFIKLHFVVTHDFPKLRYIEGGEPCAAGN